MRSSCLFIFYLSSETAHLEPAFTRCVIGSPQFDHLEPSLLLNLVQRGAFAWIDDLGVGLRQQSLNQLVDVVVGLLEGVCLVDPVEHNVSRSLMA